MRAVDEACRDQNARPPAAAAMTMAANPAAASHLLLRLAGAAGPCPLGRWARAQSRYQFAHRRITLRRIFFERLVTNTRSGSGNIVAQRRAAVP